MKFGSIGRIRLISFFVLAVAAVLVVRLYYIQVIHADHFAERADRQYVRPNQNLFDRGSIFFKDKNGRLIAAATLKTGFTVTIDPTKITDPEGLYTKLSAIIPLEQDDFLLHASKANDPYEEIAKRVSEEAAKKIEALNTPGLVVYKERWRFYPGNTLAAQAIGFVGYDESGTKLDGRYGLERFYEGTLKRDTSNLYVNFFAQVFTNLGKTISGDYRESGDIVTTIEPSVQLFLEQKFEEVQEKWSSARSGGIIIDPKTGAIFALSVHPTFNSNDFKQEENVGVFGNQLVESVYEMGSIMKPLTMAAGLDAGVVTATTTYNDHGTLTLNGKTIANFDGKGRGTVPMQEVLNQSLNTGAAFVESRLGNARFAKYIKAYGLGEETGVDLPNEVHGLINNLSSPRDIEYATASFGQGIAVTPIAMVRALATLGNGGVLVTPHLVESVHYQAGFSKTLSYHDGTQVLKPETSEEITRMLVEVVDKALVGGSVKLPHYSVAAKTGTAQIADNEEGGYYTDRYLHSFFGYAPAYNPRFLIFLFTIEPKGVSFASQTLVNPFMDTIKFLINYYDIPPDR